MALRSNENYQRWNHWAEWPMVGLGLIFLVVLILPLATDLTTLERRFLDIANISVWGLFVVDYVMRLVLVTDRRQFVRTHILDLIVIVVPFLRPFRLLRLIAIVMSTTRRAGGLVVRQVTLYVIATVVIITSTCAVIVYDTERNAEGSNIQTLGDAFWWAIVTVTTVGYGDYSPTTWLGRLVAIALMVTGIALLGVVTAAIASYFVNLVRKSSTSDRDAEASSERELMLGEIEDLRESVSSLHEKLDALGHQIPRQP